MSATDSPIPTDQRKVFERPLHDCAAHGFHFCKRCKAIVEPDDTGGCSVCGAHYVNVRFYPPIPNS